MRFVSKIMVLLSIFSLYSGMARSNDLPYWANKLSQEFQGNFPPTPAELANHLTRVFKKGKVVTYSVGDSSHTLQMEMKPVFYLFYFADETVLKPVFLRLCDQLYFRFGFSLGDFSNIPIEVSEIWSQVATAFALRDRTTLLGDSDPVPPAKWVLNWLASMEWARSESGANTLLILNSVFVGEYVRALLKQEDFAKISSFFNNSHNIGYDYGTILRNSVTYILRTYLISYRESKKHNNDKSIKDLETEVKRYLSFFSDTQSNEDLLNSGVSRLKYVYPIQTEVLKKAEKSVPNLSREESADFTQFITNLFIQLNPRQKDSVSETTELSIPKKPEIKKRQVQWSEEISEYPKVDQPKNERLQLDQNLSKHCRKDSDD